MQVDNTIYNTQTIQPFTKEQRRFNLKEANSSGNCITCQNSTNKKLVNDQMVGLSQIGTNSPTYMPTGGPTNGPTYIPTSGPTYMPTSGPTNGPTNMPTYVPGTTTFQSYQPGIFTPALNSYPPMKQNETPKDYSYNSYEDWRAPTFNQWTRIYDDNCNEENRLKIGSKPMKYYVNMYNSPQMSPFMEYTVIGGQKQYNVRNDFERAIPTRLNPVYDVSVLPYNTTPFLGQANENRIYTDTSSVLRWGSDLRNQKSITAISERDYNRWVPNVNPETVQNAGQFGAKRQNAIGTIEQNTDENGFYDPLAQNNVLFMNSAVPYFGISSRNLLHNIVDVSGC